MQRLIVTICKSNVLRASVRSGSLFGSAPRNVDKKSNTNTGLFYREYSKIPVNDLRVGMIIEAKGKFNTMHNLILNTQIKYMMQISLIVIF
jgi:hypothetical protein